MRQPLLLPGKQLHPALFLSNQHYDRLFKKAAEQGWTIGANYRRAQTQSQQKRP